MPSMKCHECGKVARCAAVPVEGEDGRATLMYLCRSCKREWLADLASTKEAGDA